MGLDEKNVYALDAGKNSWQTLTKEQILTAITQAVNEGTIGDIDTGFVTKLQEMNKQGLFQIWLGTMAEFEAIETKDENKLYIFTDDPVLDDIDQSLTNIKKAVSNIVSGDTTVAKATSDAKGRNIYDTYAEKEIIINAIQEYDSLFYRYTYGIENYYKKNIGSYLLEGHTLSDISEIYLGLSIYYEDLSAQKGSAQIQYSMPKAQFYSGETTLRFTGQMLVQQVAGGNNTCVVIYQFDCSMLNGIFKVIDTPVLFDTNGNILNLNDGDIDFRININNLTIITK